MVYLKVFFIVKYNESLPNQWKFLRKLCQTLITKCFTRYVGLHYGKRKFFDQEEQCVYYYDNFTILLFLLYFWSNKGNLGEHKRLK